MKPAESSGSELDAADRARLAALVGLCHRRWSLPILAELQKEIRPGGGGGAKFVTLANRLGLSRESLRDTLDDLIARDYLMRNPGVGHPMRPEYLLTEDGHDAAPHAAAIMRAVRTRGLEDVALRKWSLPALYAIGCRQLTFGRSKFGESKFGKVKFGQLKTALPDITPRALAIALKDLEAAKLVARTITREYPPGVMYGLTRNGNLLVAVLLRLQ